VPSFGRRGRQCLRPRWLLDTEFHRYSLGTYHDNNDVGDNDNDRGYDDERRDHHVTERVDNHDYDQRDDDDRRACLYRLRRW